MEVEDVLPKIDYDKAVEEGRQDVVRTYLQIVQNGGIRTSVRKDLHLVDIVVMVRRN